MRIALIGNPNVGKTTLFNKLTGQNQYVGNWPGVTVDKKVGMLNNHEIIDLPGIYALDTFSNEEIVSKNFLENEKPDLVINLVDANNLDRNLYLTSQISEYDIPIIIALNMIDTAKQNGIIVSSDDLSTSTGIKVVPIIAPKGEGINTLINEVEKVDKNSDKNSIVLKNKLKGFKNEKDAYKNIERILSSSLKKIGEKNRISEKIDKILLNKYLAYPIFILILWLVFKITFTWVGDPLSGAFEDHVIGPFGEMVANLLANSSEWFKSLIVDGVIAGVGAILVFLPLIMVLFFAISLLEESGYMSRAALIMDRLMRKIGLSGKAFIPMIIGFGCSVPAIMNARTLESEKDRKLAALIAPLMSCNARLPVYMLFAAVFFPKNPDIIVLSLYLLGILMAIIIGLLFKSTIFKKDEEPFIIELPNYQIPNMKSVLRNTWDKGKSFVKKAGTIIFAVSVFVWLLSNFNTTGMVSIEESFLATIGKVVAPIFTLQGFGNWQASVAILTGVMAKEVVVSTLGIVYGSELDKILPMHFSQLSAYAFMVFVLLYTPCVAVIATFKKEFGTKMMWFSIFYQFTLAWIVSLIVYQVGSLLF